MDEIMKKKKFDLFNKDFSNQKYFEKNLDKLFLYIFSNLFEDILNLPRIDFINYLITTVKAILEEKYTKEIYSEQKFFSLFLSINKQFEKKYSDYNQILSTSWDYFQNDLYNKEKNDINKYYFTEFRKHCKRTQDFAMHNCNKKEKGKLIVVYDKDNKNEQKFLICENCRKSFYIDLFLNYCQYCNCNYYCGLISQKEEPKILPATFNPPHCESIANDKILCTRCKGTFYYNLKENCLQCLNQSCRYKISPNLVNFKCNICSAYFRTDIKIYNNFELLYIRKIVGIALLIKEKAHPGILPCCKNFELNDLIFFHKKECKGSLYFWVLNQKLIVICEKCKAINYFNRFIWTCPNCGLHFRDKKEEIEEKIKKNLFNNLKSNINMKLLLGDEILSNFNIYDNNNLNNNIYLKDNGGFSSRRRRSFREILNMKKQEETLENKNQIKRHNEKSKEKKKSNDSNQLNYIYQRNSNKNLQQAKSSMKKKKNYLYEKLLRNQFLPKNYSSEKEKNIIKKSKSGAICYSDKKDNDEEELNKDQNKIVISEKKLIQYRERGGSNYLKNGRNSNHNFIIRNEKYKSEFKKNKDNETEREKEKDEKLNNSDDADKLDETSFKMDNNKRMKKNDSNCKKKLPPIPIPTREKSGKILNNNEDNNFNEEKEIILNNNLNVEKKIENNYKKNDLMEVINKNTKINTIEHEEKSKVVFNFEYTLGHQNGYNTPKIFMKNDLDRSFRKKYNKKNPNYGRKCFTLNKDILNFRYTLDLIDKENKSNEHLKQKLEDKFNGNYTQKKTKNKTISNEKEGKIKNKEKINEKDNEESIKENEKDNENIIHKNDENIDKNKNYKRNNIIYYFQKLSPKKRKNSLISKYNVYNKINLENKSTKNLGVFKGEEKPETEKELELVQAEPLLNINLEKQKIKNEQNEDNPSKPDDIINSSMVDPNIDIPIENYKIKSNELLYNAIQTQIKKILSKGKLPLFNIDNYDIERKIGEGSFGLIFQVINKKTRVKYAMKKIVANSLTSLEFYQKEFEIVHQNSHKYILDILGICIRCFDQTTYILYVLMDLALYDWDFEIEQRKKLRKFYKEQELIYILKQISSALIFLQREKKIAHRDIKPENILVFKNGIYKLGDFGEAKINKYRRNNARNTIRGTEMYMSPILFKSVQENKDDVKHDIYKSDVFSLGYCFVYAAALDFKIIYEIRNINNDYKIKRILQRVFFMKYSNEFIELLLKMICCKEEDRVDFIGLEKLLEEFNF